MKLSQWMNNIVTAVLLIGISGSDIMMGRIGTLLAVFRLVNAEFEWTEEATLMFFLWSMNGAGMLGVPKDMWNMLMNSNLFLGGFCCIYQQAADRWANVPNPEIF